MGNALWPRGTARAEWGSGATTRHEQDPMWPVLTCGDRMGVATAWALT